MSIALPTEVHRNQEAEETILQAILDSPERAPSIAEGLSAEAFYHAGNRILFKHLLSMAAEGVEIGMPTLTQRLTMCGDLEKIGGVTQIMGLWQGGSPPTPALIQHAKTILNAALMARNAVQIMHRALAESGTVTDPGPWILATAEQLQALGQESGNRHRSMRDLVAAAVDRYEEASNLNGRLIGISTGFQKLDSYTGGFQPGHLWVIGGGSSDGKSAFTQQMILHAGSEGTPCAIHTLEMSDDENVDRFFAQYGVISSESFMRGTFTHEEAKALSRTATKLSNVPIHIRDVSGIKKTELLADMRLLWRVHGIKVFAIDYGQLIASEGKHFSREREVADLSASLKAFAKQTKSTVIFVSQLNEDGKLRESRAIGFDADKSIRLRVPESEEGNEGELDDSRRILHLDKNRGGERYKRIEYDFHGSTFRFINEREPAA